MGEEVLPEKRLLEKAAKIKRFEYSSLGSELHKNIIKDYTKFLVLTRITKM